MNRLPHIACLTLVLVSLTVAARSEHAMLTDHMHHLRAEGPREWSDFPETPEASQLQLEFDAKPNATAATLRLRQQDIKQQWQVLLNEKELGRLHVDENDMVVYFDVPPGTLVEGKNLLLVKQRGTKLDDVRVGEISLEPRAPNEVLSERTIKVDVRDLDGGQSTPCRITVVGETGALQSVHAMDGVHVAVRPGIIYTSTGQAKIGLPSGRYTIYTGRGFEYSVHKTEIDLTESEGASLLFGIRREVPTNGYVACDTHVHTRTHSGHGDATVQERMITLAGEGIELPIATDHNVHIDHEPFARELNVRQYFTPVIGNEVTTRTGHFNIFPVVAGSNMPDYKSEVWQTTLDNIFATPGAKVAILNHARDVHGGTTPFGPKHFNDAVGENLDDWHMGFNAMEVINSGATQTDVMQLFRDWMALLNRGHTVTPVGSSDSHDVARHFVGQGRIYIRCDDRDPGNIDVEQAVNNFLQGRVMVSYGLLAEMKVNQRYGPGELARVVGDEVAVDLRVLGPHWTKADKIMLFANGQLVREEAIANVIGDRLPTGVLWADRWTIPRPQHDVHLVAIATGPGIKELYWRTAKPYQPDTPDPTTRTVGCSGAIWLDVDGDGKRTSAHDYARRVLEDAPTDTAKMLHVLKSYDSAVARQVAHGLSISGAPVSTIQDTMLNEAAPATRQGFTQYMNAWRRNAIARAGE
ncbi:MAG: hypothetical protein CMJ64_01685 [Planctomycetaceae bacterium]|nr:hypothetical protein [Planctomycetaceae bacterium]